MKIELGKTYINGNGNKVRIICVDRLDTEANAVVGLVKSHDGTEKLQTYSLKGICFCEYPNKNKNLASECHPAHDWEVDKPIWVRDGDGEWVARHFARVKEQVVHAWLDGRTSHSANSTIKWGYATDKNPYKE